MPRTTREYLLRFTDQLLNNLTRAIGDVQKLMEIYCGVEQTDDENAEPKPFDTGIQPKDERYRPYVEALRLIGASIAQVVDIVETFKGMQ